MLQYFVRSGNNSGYSVTLRVIMAVGLLRTLCLCRFLLGKIEVLVSFLAQVSCLCGIFVPACTRNAVGGKRSLSGSLQYCCILRRCCMQERLQQTRLKLEPVLIDPQSQEQQEEEQQ